MTEQPIDTATEQKIMRQFRGPRNRWRTAWGVAYDLGLPREVVDQYIERHPELFERSPISPSGIPVYGLREELLDRAS